MKLEKAIEAVQGKNPNAWAVGKILEEICRKSAKVRELIEQDLENKDMSLEKCFAAIKEYARKHQKGGCWACPVFEITPENEVIRVIMEFYKIPSEWIGMAGATESHAPRHDAEEQDFDLLNLL